MTEFGSASEVPDADRAEQETPLDAPTDDLSGPGEGVPEADALEQQLAARPGEAGTPPDSVGMREADDADVLEQSAAVPLDEDLDRP